MLSVWFPHFPIERLKRERCEFAQWPAEKPFALVRSEARGLMLSAVNTAAHAKSLTPGMGLADARAICPHLQTAPADPDADTQALLRLARACERYTPAFSTDGDDGLRLDITGIPHLFGGEPEMLETLYERLTRAGFSPQIAIAGTYGAAWGLARFAANPATIVEDNIPAALAPLPVEALRLTQDTTVLLKRLGLKRIGQLYDLPRANLERRFHARDAAEAVLLRLDQALGRRVEKFRPLLTPPCHSVRHAFADPLISHEGFIATLSQLAEELCAALARAGEGARRIALYVWRAEGSRAELQAGLSAPSREPAHLLRLLTDKASELDMGFGVDVMLLAARSTEPLTAAQTSLAQTHAENSPQELIDRLSNRLGNRTVYRLHPRQSHIPERAQTALPAMQTPPLWAEGAPDKPFRPPLLLTTPEPLSVMAEVPEGPPIRFTWRRVTRRVVKAEGPERICPEWWLAFTRSGRPRDYYRIEDEEGRRYWVFREGLYQSQAEDGAPDWYLHGVFG
jgi:protein ImuB